MPTARVAAALVAALVCGAPEAFAQSRPGYPAVFGGAENSGPNSGGGLVLSMTVIEAHDDNLLAAAGGTPLPTTQAAGLYTSAAPQVSFQANNRRLIFNANETSTFCYYPSLAETSTTNHNLGAGLSIKLGRATNLGVNQTVTYAPTYLYSLFTTPTGPTPPQVGEPAAHDPNYQTNLSLPSRTFGTNVNYSHGFNRRLSMTLRGDSARTNFVGHVPGFSDMSSSDGGGRLEYEISRGAKLHAGYTYREASYSSAFRTKEHDIDAGIDYSRPLSASRRSTVGFSLGPTVMQTPFVIDGNPTASSHFRLMGDAFFEHQFGRSWSARAAYHRGISYVAGLAGPVYNDSASAETTGFLSRRVDLSFSLAYSTGQIASQGASAAGFTMYTADSRLRFALSREFAALIQAIFYDYNFDQRLVIVPGVPSNFTRIGIHGGITVWVPVRSERRAAR